MRKPTLKTIINFSPKVYGLFYLALIPLFALIFWTLPHMEFKTELNIGNYWTCLYYSTVTITTLGFGDITPVSQIAQIITITESIFGLVIIGLFLNSIAHLKSSLDVAEEKEKNEKRRYDQERIKLIRYNKIIQSNIEFYMTYTIVVTTPFERRSSKQFNKNFEFRDLKDLFMPTLRMTDNHFEPAISYYFKHQKSLEKSINNLLLNVDFSYWEDLEEICFKFLYNSKELDFSKHILYQPKTIIGDKKGSVLDAEMIRNHTGEVKYKPHNAINPYIALYKQIKLSLDFIENYQTKVNEIIESEG